MGFEKNRNAPEAHSGYVKTNSYRNARRILSYQQVNCFYFESMFNSVSADNVQRRPTRAAEWPQYDVLRSCLVTGSNRRKVLRLVNNIKF